MCNCTRSVLEYEKKKREKLKHLHNSCPLLQTANEIHKFRERKSSLDHALFKSLDKRVYVFFFLVVYTFQKNEEKENIFTGKREKVMKKR